MGLEQDYTAQGGVRRKNTCCWEWSDTEGRLHRADGPAVIYDNEGGTWYWHGQLHRVDGPAVAYDDDNQQWWLHGQLHRIDGPADIGADGQGKWYVQGRDITTEVEAWMAAKGITLPFTPEQLMEFQLRWA
jgi:hypothetical protein